MANPVTDNDPYFTRDCVNGAYNWTSQLPKCDSTASTLGYYYFSSSLTINGITAVDYTQSANTQFLWVHVDTTAPVAVYSYKQWIAKDQTYCINPCIAGIHNAPQGSVTVKISRLTLDSVLYSGNLVPYAQGDSVAGQYQATVSDTFTFSIIIQRTGSQSLDVFLDDVIIREVYPEPAPVTLTSAQTLQAGTANTLYASSGFNQYYWFKNGLPLDTTFADSLAIMPDSASVYYYVVGEDDNACPALSDMLPGVIIAPGSGACDCFISPNLVQDGDFSTWPHVPAIVPGLNWYFGGTQINFAGGVELPHVSPLVFHSLQTPGFLPTTWPSTNGNRAYYVYSTQMNQIASWWLSNNVSSGVFICDMMPNPPIANVFDPIWEQEITITQQDDYCLSADVGYISYIHYTQYQPNQTATIPIVDLCLQEIAPIPGPPIIISGPISLNNANWHQLSGSANVTPGTYKIMIRGLQNIVNGARGNDVIIDNVQMGTNSMTGAQISPSNIIPYCNATPITLMEIAGNTGLNYAWSSTPGGTITGSGQSIQFTPTPSNNYIVTVTVTHPSILGCGDVASVNIESLSVEIKTKTPFFCKDDPNPIQIQAVPSVGLSWITYQWYDNGVLIPGATQLTYTVTAAGTYSVEISDGFGCTVDANIIIDEEDCCNHSAQLIPHGTTITSSTLTGPTAIIQGTVNISGTVNWSGFNIFMGANAQIDIPHATTPVNELIISGSTLRADCSIMWQGIVVQGDQSESTPKGGLIVDQGSLIQDAIEAVRSEDNGPFLLHESTFDLNWVHLQVEDYTSIPVSTHFGNISGCTLDCSGVMNLVPHIGDRTHICVNINKLMFNAKEFDLTNQVLNYTSTHSSSTLPTVYRNADMGINSQNVTVHIAHSEFQDFVCDPLYNNPCIQSYGEESKAIQAESRGGLVYINDNKFTNCYIGVLATSNELSRIRDNDFREIQQLGVWCHRNPGIYLPNGRCDVLNNNFMNTNFLSERTAAIRFTYNAAKIFAEDNTITHFYCGIVGDMNLYSPQNLSRMNYRRNTIDNDHNNVRAYGIYSKEFNSYALDINGNNIRARHTGIQTLGTSPRLRISQNDILMFSNHQSVGSNAFPVPNYGIDMIGTKGSYITDNQISGQYMPPWLYGISIDGIVDGAFCRNIMTGSRVNFLVKKPNYFTHLIQNEFFNASFNAIRFENFGNTGNQGFRFGSYVYSNKNEFNCGYSSTIHSENSPVYNFIQSVPQSRYYGYSSAIMDPHGCSNPGTSGAGIFLTECLDPDRPCVEYASAPEYYMDNEMVCGVRADFHARIHEEEEIEDFVREWLPDQAGQLLGMVDSLNAYSDLARWITKYQAFQILRQSDSIIQSDSAFIRFIDSIPNTGIGKWIEIQDSMEAGNMDAAADLLDNWTTDYVFEAYLKTVLTIELAIYLEGRTQPDSAEIETLSEIAALCPDSAYLAVHWARGMLMFASDEDFIHACEIDTISEDEYWYYDTDSLSSSVLTLYPNPADDLCTAEVDASVEGDKMIYLYNTMGYLMDVYPFDPLEFSVELEVSELTQGIYLVLLYSDSTFVESKLLSVQHP